MQRRVALWLFLAAAMSAPTGAAPPEPTRLRIAEELPPASSVRIERVHAEMTALPQPSSDDDAGFNDAAAHSKTAESEFNDTDVEVITVRYPNRRIKVKRHVIQDENRNYINHGPWTMWDPKGVMVATGTYRFGKRHGVWSRLQTGPGKQFGGEMYRGFRQPFVWEVHFHNGLLHGAWVMLDASGRRIQSWQFDQGRLHGKAELWFPNGRKMREISYYNSLLDGVAIQWDSKGKIVGQDQYFDGRQLARVVEKHPGGQTKAEGRILTSRRRLQASYDWWNGIVSVHLIDRVGKDERHGEWVHWYPDGGRKFSGRFENNRPEGLHMWWHQNGQKRASGTFVNGKEDGLWTWWHPGGFKRQLGHYAEGKKKGVWTQWDEGGAVIAAKDYTLDAHKNAPLVEADKPQAKGDGVPRVTLQQKAGSSQRSDLPEILLNWMEKKWRR